MKKVHLICNAHLDPVWLWRWDEGALEALSTFRIAAKFCEKYEGFIFNHNEVILYKWVEEYDPDLFKRIQKLVKEGKWHIMGGWYLQPDCNMPSGESIVRQILAGRKYFEKKFNKVPKTAINFDSFGHSRGLVQIMKKSGFDSYIFGRPSNEDCKLQTEDIIWVGYDGSKIYAHRPFEHYPTLKGKAIDKLERWLEKEDEDLGLILWGVGNHGGGPSKVDLEKLNGKIEKGSDEIIHSYPENYFNDLKKQKKDLPEYSKSLNPWAVGCYTSQIRIKQKHRELENELFMVEKMVSLACINELMDYPRKEIDEAKEDLLFSQFHDILPGSSIESAKEEAIRLLDHGIEILKRLKTKAFFLMANSEKSGNEEEVPIYVYNPHPYKVKGIFECEFQLANQNWEENFTLPIVYRDGKKIPSQVEKEESNLNLDWRKNVAFKAEIEPFSVNRFYCHFEKIDKKSLSFLRKDKHFFHINNDRLDVKINTLTGLLEYVDVNNDTYINKAITPIVINDDEDPWGSKVKAFNEKVGEFRLMTKSEDKSFSGELKEDIEPVRVIEDGEVRTVVESVLKYNNSFMVIKYKIPKKGTEIEIETKVFWNEKNKMLKLAIPTKLEDGDYIGQVMYGREKLKNNGMEVVAQKWTGVFQKSQNKAVSVINDSTYGSDCKNGEIRISMLRSPAYSALPIKERKMLPDDRFIDRIDQGERKYKFWLNFGSRDDRLKNIDKEALLHNEKPYVLSYYPSSKAKAPKIKLKLSNSIIQLTAFKKCEYSDNYIIRLFNPIDRKEITKLKLGSLIDETYSLKPFEIKTFELDIVSKKIFEVSLTEGKIENDF